MHGANSHVLLPLPVFPWNIPRPIAAVFKVPIELVSLVNRLRRLLPPSTKPLIAFD